MEINKMKTINEVNKTLSQIDTNMKKRLKKTKNHDEVIQLIVGTQELLGKIETNVKKVGV